MVLADADVRVRMISDSFFQARDGLSPVAARKGDEIGYLPAIYADRNELGRAKSVLERQRFGGYRFGFLQTAELGQAGCQAHACGQRDHRQDAAPRLFPYER